jgi:lactate racemase
MTQFVQLRTGAWHQEQTIQLDFPDHWEISIISGEKLPSLDAKSLKNKILKPIDSLPLREIIKGKKSAVIIVDDLTRPTPASVPVKIICEELIASGISAERITILIAGGTHTPNSPIEVEKKIGKGLHSGIKIETHNSLKNNDYVGKSKHGTPIYINQKVLNADVKIGVGGIFPHPAAGFSGGAKILAPAAAGLETIQFLHDHFQGTKERGTEVRNEFRLECELIAEVVGLDFIVNLVINEERKIADLFAGHYVSAWLKGTEFASQHYSVEMDVEANIVIADAYPFDTSLQFAHDRGLWPLEAAPKESEKIVIALAPKGAGTHVLFPAAHSFQARLWRRITKFHWRDLKSIGFRLNAAKKVLKNKEKNYLVVSPHLSEEAVKSVFPAGRLHKTWAETSSYLRNKYPSGHVRVVIYRNSPLLLSTKEI